ncbi:MAG: DUF937 domain-containing protein [Gammaproteobacteria bacterium]
MSFNLVDLIKDQVGAAVVGQMGGLLGESDDTTAKAVSGAVPGMLDGLLKSVSGSNGGGVLAGALNDTDDSLLDNLSGVLGGGGTGSLIETGTKMLGSVLGNNVLGSILGSLTGFSGMKRGSANSLMGLLAPIVFGIIKRKMLGGGGINAGSVVDMLSGQKDNIANAMPAGFGNQASPSHQPAAPVAKQGSSFGKLLPLAIIGGLLWMGYNYMTGQSTQNTVTDTMESAGDSLDQLTDVNIGNELTNIFSTSTDALGSITDVESAKAAVPALTEATSKIGGLSSMFDKLPGPAKSAVSTVAGNGMGTLQAAIDKVEQIPGVGPIIKPVVDGLMEKLAAFIQ